MLCFPQMILTYLNKWSMKSANLEDFGKSLESNSNGFLKSWVIGVLCHVANPSPQILCLSDHKLLFLATCPLRYFLCVPEGKSCFLHNRHAGRAPKSDCIPGNPIYPCKGWIKILKAWFYVWNCRSPLAINLWGLLPCQFVFNPHSTTVTLCHVTVSVRINFHFEWKFHCIHFWFVLLYKYCSCFSGKDLKKNQRLEIFQ